MFDFTQVLAKGRVCGSHARASVLNNYQTISWRNKEPKLIHLFKRTFLSDIYKQ